MVLSNINPLYFLTYLVPIAVNLALIIYYRKRKLLTLAILGYTFLAYFGAIVVKEIFQFFTEGYLVNTFGYTSPESALYFGLQTSILEVGLAYVIAGYAVKMKELSYVNSVSFGVSLSFWENGILLGVLSGISLTLDYILIAFGSPNISHLVLNAIQTKEPGLLLGNHAVILPVTLSILERTSSLFAHTAWGILVVLAAFLKKKKYLYIALPMGLIDALVPYAGKIGLDKFEVTIFVLSILFFAIAVIYLRRETKLIKGKSPLAGASVGNGKYQ